MNPNELRIGNLVFYSELPGNFEKARVGDVNLIDIHNTAIGVAEGWLGYANVAPIPLTEEWLERMGFDILDEEGYRRQCHRGLVKVKFSEIGLPLVSVYDVVFTHIFNLHQLQNFYFATTGMELTIKQPA